MFNFLKKQKKEPENLKQVLDEFKCLEQDFKKLSLKFNQLKKENQFSVQKIGLIRFNPFSQVGSNQSFSLALLDKNDNGVVITSFYTREGNRVYGKPIKKAKSCYPLSQEEIKAIESAQKKDQENETRQ